VTGGASRDLRPLFFDLHLQVPDRSGAPPTGSTPRSANFCLMSGIASVRLSWRDRRGARRTPALALGPHGRYISAKFPDIV
jgi:hypothetical protein